MHPVRARIFELPLASQVKEELGSPELLAKHSLYLELPYMLAPLFPQISPPKLADLQLYSYLYFRFLLTVDEVLDSAGKPDSNKAARIFSMFAYYEQAIRGLAELFPLQSSFWARFEQCKNMYMAANITEKKLSLSRPPYDESLFEEMATGKSAVCFAMVHALSSLANETTYVDRLLLCLRHLHIGIQCVDDVLDFVSDWQQGQYTYAHSQVEGKLRADHIDPAALPLQELHSYFYTTSAADELLALGHRHFEASRTMALELGMTQLADHLQDHISRCSSYRLEGTLLLRKSLVLATKSKKALHVSSVRPQRTTMRLALKLAEKHLASSRDERGGWLDFMSSYGESRLWATAFAGVQLTPKKANPELALQAFNSCFGLPKLPDDTFLQEAEARTFYMGLRRMVWGEVDSQEIATWLQYMQADGGWVSYRNGLQLRQNLRLTDATSVAGWLTPKCCTTAAAALMLASYPELATEFATSCEYLVRHQLADGRWPSYWWSSDVYATSFALMALSRHAGFPEASANAQQWLRQQQVPSGAWLDPMTQLPSAFYTALAVQGLQAADELCNMLSIERGMGWLLSHQQADGSWVPTRILRIPSPEVEDPATVTTWRQSSFGLNILVDDHNRVFTTSAVLKAMSEYSIATALQLL